MPKPLSTELKLPAQKKAEVTPTTAHLATPNPVRAIYMTSWVASGKEWRKKLMHFVDSSELNSIVIDVKDSTGYVTFDTQDDTIKKMGTEQVRVRDMKEFIEELHRHNIYAIARIVVFQDPLYSQKFPAQAIQTFQGTVWKDRNGLSFVDPAARPFWDYIIRISNACEKVGFDELNFDYVRYPTDGNITNMTYPLTLKNYPKSSTSPSLNIKVDQMDHFFGYLRQGLAPLKLPLSVDIFGMTMTHVKDVGIGQRADIAAKHFDYVCPMIYPSHWPRGTLNLTNPAAHPYEIVRYCMKEGLEKVPAKQLRPWLQDFNLGTHYGVAEVIAQKRALYELGITGFMVWDPRNKYTIEAYSRAPRKIRN